ncbi:hypothetical protein KKG24_03395 [Patescibacteria group bacterium]|nr:hypothetical protein [Patescibacteria group bacterium]
MINLIPKEEKKKMIKAFYYRLGILFVVMLNLCLLVAFFSILPSYFISSVKNSLINTRLENQKLKLLPPLGEESLALIKDIDNKLSLVEKFEKNKFLVSSEVINAILLQKIPDIKITQILYKNDEINGRKISITGIAPSREVLLLFRQLLEDSPAFTSVDLPISNFVKGSDINFHLSLIPSEHNK